MMHARVFHAEDHLKNQAAFRSHFYQTLHSRMVEIERLIAGINPNARHFVNFVTAPHVFVPIRPGQIDAAKGNQKTSSMLPTFGPQARVDPIHIFGEERFETSSPRLDDTVLLELRDQSFRVTILQGAKRPVEQIHVGIDDSDGGSGNSGAASRSLRRQHLLVGEGNSSRAQQGILQETASIDWLHDWSYFAFADQSSNSLTRAHCRFQVSKFNLHSLLAEDGRAKPAEVPTEDLHPVDF